MWLNKPICVGNINQFGINICHHNNKSDHLFNHLHLFWDFPKCPINKYSNECWGIEDSLSFESSMWKLQNRATHPPVASQEFEAQVTFWRPWPKETCHKHGFWEGIRELYIATSCFVLGATLTHGLRAWPWKPKGLAKSSKGQTVGDRSSILQFKGPQAGCKVKVDHVEGLQRMFRSRSSSRLKKNSRSQLAI
jgi:hypothetical protein